MNDPEVTMSNARANTNLIAHQKALEAAGIAIKLVMRVPAPLKSIADQAIRSASSVPANLAEGAGRDRASGVVRDEPENGPGAEAGDDGEKLA